MSNPKISSKEIQIFNYFLHMMDFGHIREFLKKAQSWILSDGLL